MIIGNEHGGCHTLRLVPLPVVGVQLGYLSSNLQAETPLLPLSSGVGTISGGPLAAGLCSLCR